MNTPAFLKQSSIEIGKHYSKFLFDIFGCIHEVRRIAIFNTSVPTSKMDA